MNFQFLSGEILSGFSCLADSHYPIMQIGYSNGMVGYIPSANDFSSGGYEVDGSREKFRMSNRICKILAIIWKKNKSCFRLADLSTTGSLIVALVKLFRL